jgi:hypothetical protein
VIGWVNCAVVELTWSDWVECMVLTVLIPQVVFQGTWWSWTAAFLRATVVACGFIDSSTVEWYIYLCMNIIYNLWPDILSVSFSVFNFYLLVQPCSYLVLLIGLFHEKAWPSKCFWCFYFSGGWSRVPQQNSIKSYI